VHAQVGDRIVVEGRTIEQHRREGVVVEVQGAQGGPPYRVRWDDGHEGLVFPSNDAHIKHADA
jgi:hypothetical protein